MVTKLRARAPVIAAVNGPGQRRRAGHRAGLLKCAGQPRSGASTTPAFVKVGTSSCDMGVAGCSWPAAPAAGGQFASSRILLTGRMVDACGSRAHRSLVTACCRAEDPAAGALATARGIAANTRRAGVWMTSAAPGPTSWKPGPAQAIELENRSQILARTTGDLAREAKALKMQRRRQQKEKRWTDPVLKGKRALVTGGNRGINERWRAFAAGRRHGGAAGARPRDAVNAAEIAAATGARVVGVGRRMTTRPMQAAVAERCRSAAPSTSWSTPRGRAGDHGRRPLARCAPSNCLLGEVDTKVALGYVRCAQAVVPGMQAAGWGPSSSTSAGWRRARPAATVGSIRIGGGQAALTKRTWPTNWGRRASR